MSDHYYIGAYWGPREETAAQCAQRLEQCLTALADIHPSISAWKPLGNTLAEATSSNRVLIEAAALRPLVESGRSRDNRGGVIDDLGYLVSLWNGDPNDGANFNMSAGGYSVWVKNCFVLSLPAPGTTTLELYTPDAAAAAFDAIIESWEPDWATWTSYAMREPQPDDKPVVGWATYLESSLFSTIAAGQLPQTASVRRTDKGAIIRMAADPMGVSDEDVLGISTALAPLPQ